MPDLPITGVTLRAQDVQSGDLFAALSGSSTHGARYLGDAIERGAVAVLTDAAGVAEIAGQAERSHAVPVLVHPEPRSVLGELAAAVYGRPSERLAVVGVTGTSGKTTTTYLLEAGLRAAGRAVGLDRHDRPAYQRRRRPQRADHARGARAAGPACGDGRARRRHRGDGGVQPRADARPRRRRAFRGRRLSPTCPATTSTSTRRWRTTSRPRRGCSTRRHRCAPVARWSASTTTPVARWPTAPTPRSPSAHRAGPRTGAPKT